MNIRASKISREGFLRTGDPFGSRVCVHDDGSSLFLVNKDSVQFIQIEKKMIPSENKTKNPKIPFPNMCQSRNHKIWVSPSKSKKVRNFVSSSKCEQLFGIVDDYGNIDIFETKINSESTKFVLDDKFDDDFLPTKKRKLEVMPLTWKVNIECSVNNPFYESGWCGLAFNPMNKDCLSTVRYFGKELNMYRRGRLERTIFLASTPTCVKYFRNFNSNQCMLAVIEEKQVLLFDQRDRKFIANINPRLSNLRDIDNRENDFAVAGERCVLIYEPRKWTMTRKVSSALKTQVSRVLFSSKHPVCYVMGSNSMNMFEVSGEKSKTDDKNTIYFDSELVGWDKLICDADTFAGVSKNEQAYFLENPYRVLQK